MVLYYKQRPRIDWTELLMGWFMILALVVIPVLVGLGVYKLWEIIK